MEIMRKLRMMKKEKKKKSVVEDMARERADLRKTAGKRKAMIRNQAKKVYIKFFQTIKIYISL